MVYSCSRSSSSDEQPAYARLRTLLSDSGTRGRYLPENVGRCPLEAFWHRKNRRLELSSLLAFYQTACEALRERRSKGWSGRRDSNPRQPAWKAGCHTITARFTSSGSTSGFCVPARCVSAPNKSVHKHVDTRQPAFTCRKRLLLIPTF